AVPPPGNQENGPRKRNAITNGRRPARVAPPRQRIRRSAPDAPRRKPQGNLVEHPEKLPRGTAPVRLQKSRRGPRGGRRTQQPRKPHARTAAPPARQRKDRPKPPARVA